MLFYQFRRMKRTPVAALAVLLFAAVLTLILCNLHTAALQEQEEYKKVMQETPVVLTVTNLNGTRDDGLGAPLWVLGVFTGGVDHSLREYVNDVYVEASYITDSIDIDGETSETLQWTAIGVCAESQIPVGAGETVNWQPGFDGTYLTTVQHYCVIPESLAKEGIPDVITLHFSYVHPLEITYYYDLKLTVAGTHPGNAIYCSYKVMQGIYNSLGQTVVIDSVSAVLRDNYMQQEATERARYWFPAPDLTGTKIPWDYSWYTYYPYALRVDDSQLRSAKETISNSMAVNTLCTTIVFLISAVAGFLIGFLMIRSRKRELALMRTMGTSNVSVFFGLAIEQMLCVILGAVAGGAGSFWQPVQRLCIFVGVYFVGMTVALVVFLRTNLLSSMKEEE